MMQIDSANVVVPGEKLTDYLLSGTHPIGRYKSAFFLSLGYTPGEPHVLEADLKSLLLSAAEPGDLTEFGQKLLSRGPLTGPNGQMGRVLAVWIILSGDPLIRFITAYPEG